MEQWEIGWIAGIFEGEGSITFTGRNGVRVSLGSTDGDVVETLHRLFPVNGVYRYEKKNRIKPLYVWRADDKRNVEKFLRLVLPFLHSRRKAKAEAALVRLQNNPGARPSRTHCLRGHPLSGDNVRVDDKTRARSCWTCRRMRDEARIR